MWPWRKRKKKPANVVEEVYVRKAAVERQEFHDQLVNVYGATYVGTEAYHGHMEKLADVHREEAKHQPHHHVPDHSHHAPSHAHDSGSHAADTGGGGDAGGGSGGGE